jgi:hypothetical protein
VIEARSYSRAATDHVQRLAALEATAAGVAAGLSQQCLQRSATSRTQTHSTWLLDDCPL